MSDDPETARQIAELSLDARPLLVLDVDDVVLRFVTPLQAFFGTRGVDLRLDSFRLHGNAFDRASGLRIDDDAVSALIDAFFDVQAEWQTATDDAASTIAALAESAEIVLLTAMPHRHRERRRVLLDDLGISYPLVTTETAKGPAIRALRGSGSRPVAFVDDIPHNLASVRDSVADARLFHLTATPALRAHMPRLPDGAETLDGWRDAGPRIAGALGIPFTA